MRRQDALSQVQDPTPAVRDLDALTTNASTKDGRTVRAFNPLSRNERSTLPSRDDPNEVAAVRAKRVPQLADRHPEGEMVHVEGRRANDDLAPPHQVAALPPVCWGSRAGAASGGRGGPSRDSIIVAKISP